MPKNQHIIDDTNSKAVDNTDKAVKSIQLRCAMRPDLYTRLSKYAKAKGISEGEVMRWCISAQLEKVGY